MNREVLTTIDRKAIMTSRIASILLRRLVAIATPVALTLGVTATAIANEPLPPIASQQDVTTLSGPNINAINIRSGPGTINPVVKTLAPGESLRIGCWKPGDTVTGPYGASTTWYQIDGAENQWISDAYVYTGQNYPTTMECDDEVPALPDAIPGDNYDSPKTEKRGAYDPEAAVDWARAHYNDPARYGNTNCTWFVSQALWAGGLPKDADWTDLSFDPMKVYPGNVPGPTSSARFAYALAAYLNNHGLTSKHSELSWSDNTAGNADIGDLIFYDLNYDDKYTQEHVAIVTGFSRNSDGTVYPLVTQQGQADKGWSWGTYEGKEGWIQEVYPTKASQPRAFLLKIRG